MRKILTFLFAALMSAGMWALTPQGEDTWDDATKTLTVKGNPENNAYSDVGDIENLVISDAVTSIGESAFANCTGLTSVTIGNSVTSIGKWAFHGCTGLTSITIPNSVTSIEVEAFSGCSNLETVTILAESLESYGTDAFEGTAAALKIYVPAGSVDTYKAAWTAYADKIEAIVPEWVRDGDEWDEATKTLTVKSNLPVNAYMGQTVIEHVIISNNVTSIGAAAFAGCTGMTSIEIPSSVTNIGADAFNGCTAVTDVYCYPNAANLTWDDDGKDDFKADGSTVCHVHADQLSAYQSKFTGEVNVTFVGDLPAPEPEPSGSQVDVIYKDKDAAQLDIEEITLHLPDAPVVSGFTFVKWVVVGGDLEDGIIIQAAYRANIPTNAQEVSVPGNPAQKLIREGNLYILKDGKTYNVQGAVVK